MTLEQQKQIEREFQDAKTPDEIDKAGGYCPCQVPSADSKCHCKDFLKVKKIGEPCICGIYVKMAKDAKKKGAK